MMEQQKNDRKALQAEHDAALTQAENTLQREKELLEAQLTEGIEQTEAAKAEGAKLADENKSLMK